MVEHRHWRRFTHIGVLLIALLVLDLLLNLLILDVVAALNVQNTMNVDTGLELADHEVILAVSLDVLDRKAADPGVGVAGELFRLGIASLEVEGLFSVKCENFGGGHDITLVEDGKAGVLIGNIGGLLPAKLNGVADDVLDGEVANAEDGGENGAAEGRATGEGLIGVEGVRQRLAEELLDALLESRDTGTTTDNLDDVDVLLGELGLGKSLLEGLVDLCEKRLNHGLELLAGNHGGGIDVVHERLDVDGSLLVGRQNLLGLLSGGDGSGHGTAVTVDVDLVLALELLGEMVDESLVEVSATEILVPSGGLDGKLALLELNDANSVAAVADVDKGNTAGPLLRSREVKLGDTPAKSGSSAVVDEAEELEAGDLGGVDQSTALDVSEPRGDAHADVGDGELELGTGGGLDFAEVHGDKLGGRELLLVAQVGDLGADLAVDIDKRGGDVLLLVLDIGVVEGSAGKTLEAADGVLEIGDFLSLGGLTEVTRLGTKAYQRTGGKESQ